MSYSKDSYICDENLKDTMNKSYGELKDGINRDIRD